MSQNNWNIIGHQWAVSALQRDILSHRLRHAYLIAGPDGIGKRTLALAFARALFCDRLTACGDCRACLLVQHGNHPDLAVLAPEVSGKVIRTEKIMIDQVRDLIKLLTLKPSQSERRVAVITNFDAANEQAANALLKTLEEPPGNTIIILTADSADDLLPTITSRCEVLSLRALSANEIKDALVTRWGKAGPQAELLARLSGGRLGWAATADESALEQRQARLDELQKLLRATRVERFAYAEVLSRDRELMRETLALWQSWWRDVLSLAAGSDRNIINADQLTAMRQTADAVGVAGATQPLNAIQKTLSLLPRNINARLALETLLLDLPRL